jgi:hypothetical protein
VLAKSSPSGQIPFDNCSLAGCRLNLEVSSLLHRSRFHNVKTVMPSLNEVPHRPADEATPIVNDRKLDHIPIVTRLKRQTNRPRVRMD